MSKRDWKPGDVAMDASGHRWFATGKKDGAVCWFGETGNAFVGGWPSLRPVVVVDAENREQVERLVRLLWPHYADHESARLAKTDMAQASLREYLATPPPPKPEEPQGLGALVEDADERWVHFGNGCWIKTVPNANLRQKPWDDFTADVTVLTEGVPS